MLTLAEPSSSDDRQQRLAPQNGEMLLSPSLFSMIEQSEQKSKNPLKSIEVPSNVTNKISTLNDKTSANISRNEVLDEIVDKIFNGIPQHEKVLELLLKDIQRGNHLLLIGNRGLEKNKSADGVLKLLNRPTEHIQLNRDTTIQSLTVQPTVKDGIEFYEDSPLIKAVKYGHVLVIDEVDKAPANVICSLNTLMETGEMELSDGRRIVPQEMYSTGGKSAKFIPAHKDFRMILKASKTEFPFLKKDISDHLGLKESGVRSVTAPLPPGSRTRRQTGAIGTIVKAVGIGSKVTTAVIGGSSTGPHTATAVASGSAVAIATSITYDSGSSTSTAIASGTSTASASSYSYDQGVATTTAISAGSSSAVAEAIARGTERKTDTKILA